MANSGLDHSQTQDLLVKLVHPLFLKANAEASKADNPNWKQAMSGPFANEFWKAAVKEYRTLEKGWMLGRLLIDLFVQRSLTLFGPSKSSNFQMD